MIKKEQFLVEWSQNIRTDYTFDPNSFIGEGGFGRVYKGVDKETGELRAIKHLYRSKLVDTDQFLKEVNNLK